MNLQIFMFAQDRFNRTAIITVGFILSNQTFKPPPYYGPFYFIFYGYPYYVGKSMVSNRIFIPTNLFDHQLYHQIPLIDPIKAQTRQCHSCLNLK